MAGQKSLQYIVPDWPAPSHVHAIQTTRVGGVSAAPFNALNLGDHVGDDALAVLQNRQMLTEMVPTEPLWLTQVHGTTVINMTIAMAINTVANVATTVCLPEADASVAHQSGVVCTVMTADCLPVLLCDSAGTVVGAAHAGWRGLAAGVIEASVHAMQVAPASLMAWLGPAIGPQAFKVGEEVLQAFVGPDADAVQAFRPVSDGKWLADIYLLARQRLQKSGIRQIYGGNYCTYSEPERFFSYRRDGQTGRMASMIWIDKSA